MIVEDVDDDAAAVAEFRIKSLAALPGVWTVMGETVDTAVQVQTEGQFLREIGRDRTFDEVAHQATEL